MLWHATFLHIYQSNFIIYYLCKKIKLFCWMSEMFKSRRNSIIASAHYMLVFLVPVTDCHFFEAVVLEKYFPKVWRVSAVITFHISWVWCEVFFEVSQHEERNTASVIWACQQHRVFHWGNKIQSDPKQIIKLVSAEWKIVFKILKPIHPTLEKIQVFID